MTPDEEAAYVREVAAAKTAALRTSLDAVERQGMPFVGETGGLAPGQGMGAVPPRVDAEGGASSPAGGPQSSRAVGGLPGTEPLIDRVREARESAARHAAEQHAPRAPRPEKMQR